MAKNQIKSRLEIEISLENSWEAFDCFTEAVRQVVDFGFIDFMQIKNDVKNHCMTLVLILHNVREFTEENGRFFEFYDGSGRFVQSLSIVPDDDNFYAKFDLKVIK